MLNTALLLFSCHYADSNIFIVMLTVITINVVPLNVVAPFDHLK
jgi:hypothetical protein